MPTALPEEAQPVNALYHLCVAFRSRFSEWLPNTLNGFPCDTDNLLHPKASAAVEIYDEALRRLEGKTGDRADAARAQIEAARAPIAAALELVNSIGGQYDGPLALELRKRITSTRAGLAAALNAKDLATRAEISAALIEVEAAYADIRELDRDLAAIYEGIRKLPLPDLQELRSAEASTRALEQLPEKKVTAADVHSAIELGMKAPTRVGALFVAFETKPDHPLIQWRTRAFTEREQ